MKQIIILGIIGFTFFIGCTEEGDQVSVGGGTFPNISTLLTRILPTFGSIGLTAIDKTFYQRSQTNLVTVTNNIPDITNYGDDWETVSSQNAALFNEVFNREGSVTSVFVVMDSVASNMEYINSNHFNSEGEYLDCTSLSEGFVTEVPFFKSNDEESFVDWNDSGKYLCYIDRNGETIAFGRHAVTASDETCQDPYEYFTLSGGGSDLENSEDVERRGNRVVGSGVFRTFYNGCSQDLKVIYAQSTVYSGGVEFQSRTEIEGNVGTSTFSVRVGFTYKSVPEAQSEFTTIIGSGRSRKESADSDDANFIMGYSKQRCAVDTNDCLEELAFGNYCVKNTSTEVGSYDADPDESNCSPLEDGYLDLSGFDREALPVEAFPAEAADFGL